MIQKEWFQHFSFPIDRITPINGGETSESYRIDSGTESYLIKLLPHTGIELFRAEMMGLQTIGKVVNTPHVLDIGKHENIAYLILDWIPEGKQQQSLLGETIANLHQSTSSHFGYLEDNFLGTSKQLNGWYEDWTEFFITHRLEEEIKKAKETQLWNSWRETKFKKLKEKIQNEWPKRQVKPSLLHGDLWVDNVIFSLRGEVILIDPAIYYGDREVDIAMTQLFSGFSQEFLDAYQKIYPLEENWQERIPVYQLYYLLSHLNTIGESYGPSVDQILGLF